MELIDYTQFYYTVIVKTGVPPVVIGKFVQIRNESTEYLVLSPKEFTKYHADIVERFCFDKGLKGSYDADRKRYDIHDQAWVIAGGGKFEIDAIKKSVRLYDDSMAYGKFDARGLSEKVDSIPALSGYAVVLDN